MSNSLPSPSGALGISTRIVHDVGLAAWVGGSLFGKLAFNPSVKLIPDEATRGRVTNATYGAYNPINAAALAVAAGGWVAARGTEARPNYLTGTEQILATVKDVLLGVGVVSGVLTGVDHLRLGRQGPDGAVPVEDPTTPAADTPSTAASILRRLGVVTSINIASGIGVIAITAAMAQLEHSRPPVKRALLRRSR